MIFEQKYSSSSLAVVSKTVAKVFKEIFRNCQDETTSGVNSMGNILFPSIERNDGFAPVPTGKEEQRCTSPFAQESKNAQNAVFVQKRALYHKLAFCNTKLVSHDNKLLARSVFVIHKKLRNKKKFSVSQCDTK